MKKITNFLIILILFINAHSQTQKKPLLEVFTSSTCSPCVEGNKRIDSLLEKNPNKYSIIKYQMNWPGKGDPYYTNEGGSRRYFYKVTGVPSLFVNGGQKSAFNITQDTLNTSFSEKTDLTISVSPTLNNDSTVDIAVELLSTAAYDSGLSAQIVVAEKITTENTGTNSEKSFSNVMMKMAPNAVGTILNKVNPNQKISIREKVDLKNTNMETLHDLEVIVFVQNNTTNEVIQSEMVPIPTNIPTYTCTLTIIDSSQNRIENAIVHLKGIGDKTTDKNGVVIFNDVPKSDIEVTINCVTFLETIKTVSIVDKDISQNIILTSPDALIFENFNVSQNGLPNGWTKFGQQYDMMFSNPSGLLVFLAQSDQKTIGAITPSIDLSKAEKLTFEHGKANGTSPRIIIATSATPDTNSMSKLLEVTSPEKTMQKEEIDMSQVDPTHKYILFLYDNTEKFKALYFDNIVCSRKGGTDIEIIAEKKQQKPYSIFAKNNILHFNCNNSAHIQLIGVNGKLLLNETVSQSTNFQTNHISNQVALVKITMNGKTFIEKITF